MLLKPSEPCSSCLGRSWGRGDYVPASGSGENGVLIVAEAAGENEAKEGMPLVGKAGYYLFQNLARVGIDREGFRLHNVLSCRPPNNKLAKMAYEQEVIDTCAPLLDATILDMRRLCRQTGKTFTILTLGRIAFKRILGLKEKDPLLKEDYLCYPFWQSQYGAWVIAADHPSYLMRGNNHLLPVLQFAAKRALEIAAGDFKLSEPHYLLDPHPSTFQGWIADYKRAVQTTDDSFVLSYDIETPYKSGKNEEKVAREDDEDFTILRCSFAYQPGQAISVPWRADYKPLLEDLFSFSGPKVGWNNSNYDSPRVKAQMELNGVEIDGMLAWHVLNSALPKGLGFVTPFYAQDAEMWKHLAHAQPAFYNAKDADMALRCYLGIRKDLRDTDLGRVFQRHVVDLDVVTNYMSRQGVLRDETLRKESEVKLSAMLDTVEATMLQAIPETAKKVDIVYKKEPKDKTGLLSRPGSRVVRVCRHCGLQGPRKDHFKRYVKKLNPCADDPGAGVQLRTVEVVEWYRLREWKVSHLGLTSYQQSLRHQAILNRREHRTTFDEDALKTLIAKYPKDPLYPSILKHRELQKLLSTYIGITNPTSGLIRGGMTVGRDGRIHCELTHNPSTLRMACQNPNMQNLPRAKREEDLQTIIRNLIIASPGCILLELDFSAIEAVLVGYFAGLPDYIRLSKLGIHSYLASHVLGRPADLSWSNMDLKSYFLEIKKSKDQAVQDIYNGCKRAIHLSGYGGTPRKMHSAEPETFKTVKDAERLQGIYFDLFPAVKRWQLSCQLQAEKDGFLRNPFGYVHRFYRVFSYRKEFGKWIRTQGDDQNKVLAFLPQSTAAGIIKEAMLRLFYDHFDQAGQWLRLQVHDSLVCDVPTAVANEVGNVLREEMTRPVPELRLPASYGMGDYLSIEVEQKIGTRWGSMR